MYNQPKYAYYRKKKIPGWWMDYLPNETNPYERTDTLTIHTGCLADYWHIHSSNKHPNSRGVEACNFVQGMIYNRFGAAFLSSEWQYSGGRQGQKIYNDKKHIVYKNAYIGEDQRIHINDAYQYYEDVVSFVMQVLREISRNHYQSGNSYNASDFFPQHTDAEIQKIQAEHERKITLTEECEKLLEEYLNSDAFIISEIFFENTTFNALHDYDDGWFNEMFSFGKISSNIDESKGKLSIIVDFPRLYGANFKKKNTALATKTLEVPFCLYLHSVNKDAYPVTIAIPGAKVTENVIAKVDEGCNIAMDNYNKEHIELIENNHCKPVLMYYPQNIFLDNKIKKLKLVYKENAGRETWRMRWSH